MLVNRIKWSFMQKSRKRKYDDLIELLEITKGCSVLDIGVADQEYSPVDNYFEKKYPYPHNITVLSVEKLERFYSNYSNISCVYYKGDVFPFQDKCFNAVISNAVIEHVGQQNEQIQFVNEMLRVGEKVYFTTPAKEFPIEMHTNFPLIHWLPESFFNKLIIFLGKEWAAGNYMNLLSKKALYQILSASTAENFKIITHKIGMFPLHYIVVVR
jgi:SAM-dependent methyltransferase